MAMKFEEFCLVLVLLLAYLESTVSVIPSVIPPESSPPGPAPISGDGALSPLSPVPSSGGPAPANGPVASSPPAPPAGTPAPASSPSPSADKPPVPSPAPSNASGINHSDINANGGEAENSSGGGMSGGKKAGIAVAVIGAACVVGLGGLVYKKRQENIRRSQYSYTARREIL